MRRFRVSRGNLYEEEVCQPFSMHELNTSLENLPTGKASGCDKVANELLSHTGEKFRGKLLLLLNKILEEGRVPSDFNVGKCMLIFKVIVIEGILLCTKLFSIHIIEWRLPVGIKL